MKINSSFHEKEFLCSVFCMVVVCMKTLSHMKSMALVTHILPHETDVVISVKNVIKERMVSLEGEPRRLNSS